jgi:hypothetical protein
VLGDNLVGLVEDGVFGDIALDDAAAFAGDADGDVAGQGDSVHPPALGSVVGDDIVLGGPVVPDREVARLPNSGVSRLRSRLFSFRGNFVPICLSAPIIARLSVGDRKGSCGSVDPLAVLVVGHFPSLAAPCA